MLEKKKKLLFSLIKLNRFSIVAWKLPARALYMRNVHFFILYHGCD